MGVSLTHSLMASDVVIDLPVALSLLSVSFSIDTGTISMVVFNGMTGLLHSVAVCNVHHGYPMKLAEISGRKLSEDNWLVLGSKIYSV